MLAMVELPKDKYVDHLWHAQLIPGRLDLFLIRNNPGSVSGLKQQGSVEEDVFLKNHIGDINISRLYLFTSSLLKRDP